MDYCRRKLGITEAAFAPASGEVHLFPTPLNVTRDALGMCSQVLSPDERSRAARFLVEEEGRRYIVSHGLLRVLIAACLGCEPRDIRFERAAGGKPRLASSHGASWLRFNMSRSRGFALYAIAREHEVGVDIEYRDAALAGELFSASALPAAVRSSVAGMSPELGKIFLFDGWTRFEASAKALGSGLVDPVDSLPESWTVFDCSPDPSYAAACAVEGRGVRAIRHAYPSRDFPFFFS